MSRTGSRGIALPLAVFALVMVGALVSGAFFIGRQEQTVGRNSVKLQQAFAVAEAGAHSAVANWSTEVYNALATGGTTTIGGSMGTNGWYRGEVRRLNDQLFLVRSEGFSRDSTARQQVGLLVRLRPIEITLAAALETRGDLELGGSATIDGTDTAPAGWTCPPAGPPIPRIRIADPDSAVAGFGDVAFEDLEALATKVLPGGTMPLSPAVAGAACDRAPAGNWGSPLTPAGPCGNYFPVIWVDGSLTLNGGQGQGILLVDGDLRLQGGVEFYGPVIVRGRISSTGAGGRVVGGVLAANSSLEPNTLLGDTDIRYSSCALSRTLQASARGALLRERSWVNLY